MKMLLHGILLCLLLLVGGGMAAELAGGAEGGEVEIEIENLTAETEIEYDYERGISRGINGVLIRYGTVVLTADKVTLDRGTGEAVAEGAVSLQSEGQLWRGERLQYNFLKKTMSGDSFRVGAAPFFASGQFAGGDQAGRSYTATHAFVTTDDVANPAYRVKASSLTITPGEAIEARGAKFYAGDVPVFYFPYYRRNLDALANQIVLTPGYRTVYGPYMLGSYEWHWSTNFGGALNLDYRQKRGVGLGPDFAYDMGRWGEGELSFYYLNDLDPGEDLQGRAIEEHRHRFSFNHLAVLRTNLTAKVVVGEQSDAFVVRDFLESEYRDNPEPKTLFEVNQLWSNWSLDFLAQAQLNDFYQTVERLPDIKLSGMRQQLGVSPFYYEGESSAGYFRFEPRERSGDLAYEAMRLDSFHQVLLPKTFFGWLNVTPRLGGRFTHYGKTDGEGFTLEDQNRAVFNTGAEVSFKASQVWAGARSGFWDVSGLRHIVQPSLNYVFVPEPNAVPRELPQFDTEIPSLRLLPVDFPDYNSIDSIDTRNVVRIGLRNKFQTKRRDAIDNLLNWGLYTDWRLDRQGEQSSFADLYSDLDLKPRSWLLLSSETRTDMEEGVLRMANHAVTITPSDVWNLAFGHRYFKEDPAFGPDSENNLFFSSFYYRFNENWAARLTHHYEASDGKLEEQYYTLYRDLRSWTSALTLRVRDNREGQDDFTIAITFSLKAFPRFKLGKDRDNHSLLLGG